MFRSHSRLSMASVGSSVGGGDNLRTSTTPNTSTSPLQSHDGGSGERGVKKVERKEANVSMWKGDSQILAIDLQRELTTKVAICVVV